MSTANATTIGYTTTTELLQTALGGNTSAWELLVNRFEPAVAATITGYRLQEADARDAAQRTWLRMLEHGRQIREPEALGGWLRTTAKRECLRIINDRRRVEPRLDAETSERPDPSVDVEQVAIDADMTRQLRAVLTLIPSRSATLICTLFEGETPGYAEIARSTGIPVGTIGPTRARILRRLRGLIETESVSRSVCRA